MKTLTGAFLIMFLVSASLAGWRVLSQSDTYVVGGEFIIPAGGVLHGDIQALFAQVRLAHGARVDGKITAVSSTLDLAGSVGGAVLAIGSDVTVQATAELAHAPRAVEGIPYVVLLPALVRTGSQLSMAQ